MPVYVPREMIHAAGMLPVGIIGGGDQLEVIHGDAYYQSYICRIPRSTIELGVTGRLDCLDGMLFPSICDVIRNLSGMWKMLFPDKYVALLRRAAELSTTTSAASSTSTRCRRCARTWRELRGEPITDDALRASIARLQREPRGGARALRVPRREALAGAHLRGLSAAARRHGAAGRGAHRAAARLPRRRRGAAAARARQLPRRADRRRSASSRRSA